MDTNIRNDNAAAPVAGATVKAYLHIRRRLAECDERKLRTDKQRRDYQSFVRRIAAACESDPHETTAIQVPWDEWDAYTRALNDRSGG